MSERSFSGKEIGTVLSFLALTALIGWGSYHTGHAIAERNNKGAGEMVAAVADAPVNGQTLFAGNCAGCHGANAEGAMGPALKPAGSWSDAEFKEAVLHGKAPTRNLAPTMPHFADTGLDGQPATDEQINAIHTFIKGL